jgi:hypothetical protein
MNIDLHKCRLIAFAPRRTVIPKEEFFDIMRTRKMLDQAHDNIEALEAEWRERWDDLVARLFGGAEIEGIGAISLRPS